MLGWMRIPWLSWEPLASALGAEPDWQSVGLVLSLIGAFLLGNAILFRHPRELVRELFGRAPERLHTIRAFIFHRVQVAVGFTFLVSGFALQLYGRVRPPPIEPEPSFPVVAVGCIVLLTIAFLCLGWWWSSRAFRRYVREHFLEHPPDFESQMTMAREVGDLFGVESHRDDTVQSYAERLRRAIDLPEPERQRRRDMAMPPVEEVEVE
jgi:hypothetical protein